MCIGVRIRRNQLNSQTFNSDVNNINSVVSPNGAQKMQMPHALVSPSHFLAPQSAKTRAITGGLNSAKSMSLTQPLSGSAASTHS